MSRSARSRSASRARKPCITTFEKPALKEAQKGMNMYIQLLSNFVSLTLAAIFAGLAAVQFLRVLRPRTSFGIADSRWRRFLGGLFRALAALFLALPPTRI